MVFRRMSTLAEMDRVGEIIKEQVSGGLGRQMFGNRRTTSWSGINLDVYQIPEALVVRATIPNVKAEEVEVTITDNVLKICGESATEIEEEEKSYLVRELSYGRFERDLVLPKDLETQETTATCQDGLLLITIPKTEKAKPMNVNVKKS